MRTLRYTRYGPPDVLTIEDAPEPLPGANQAKVRVRAVSLNPLDWKIRAGHLRFIPVFRGPPRGVGTDFAGEVVGVGGGATTHFKGERVFGSLLPFGRQGALDEFIAVPFDRILRLPDDVAFEQGAALPVAGGTALQALADQAHLTARQRVLIVGAAGGVGHFATQIAKSLGAYVVAVCSAGNADMVRRLGADEVIDYAREDFTRRDDRFDVVFDPACASSFPAARRVLTESGCYLSTTGNASAAIGTAVSSLLARVTSRQRAMAVVLKSRPEMWQRLLQLVRDEGLRAHIERTVTLPGVAEAMRAMETGHGRGKIVVRMD